MVNAAENSYSDNKGPRGRDPRRCEKKNRCCIGAKAGVLTKVGVSERKTVQLLYLEFNPWDPCPPWFSYVMLMLCLEKVQYSQYQSRVRVAFQCPSTWNSEIHWPHAACAVFYWAAVNLYVVNQSRKQKNYVHQPQKLAKKNQKKNHTQPKGNAGSRWGSTKLGQDLRIVNVSTHLELE